MAPQKIAELVINTFDATTTLTVEQAIIRCLQERGMTEAEAIDNAPDNVINSVLRCLQIYQQDRSKLLPFYFSESTPAKLVGKARRRPTDNAGTLKVRNSLHLENELHDSIYKLGDNGFEKLVAKLMLLSGASDAHAGCTNDDGGIDVWGRVPILDTRLDVSHDLLPVKIIDSPMLFLAQCKCYKPVEQHGPEVIHTFASAVSSCINKYQGNSHPPSHRVPDSYFERGEQTLSLFFSTATFSSKATSLARSLRIHIVGGKKIARYLLLHQVGINHSAPLVQVDVTALNTWINVS